jgi:uncharacterized SAM-binding protein YcdF (DUF218 family)
MFFILSKLLLFSLSPFNWMIIILLIAIFFTKKAQQKKRLYATVIILFFVFSNKFLFNRIMMQWQPAPVTLHLSYSAGIVLGGFTSFDKYGGGFFGGSADRFIQTERLYRQHTIQKIIISGGTGTLDQSRPREASFVRNEFIKQGVPAEDIFYEDRSRNTGENAIESKKLLDSLHINGPIVLITSAVHMRRSEHIFKSTGIDAVEFPCDYNETDLKFTPEEYFMPDLETLVHWQRLLKEVVGLVVFDITKKG